MISKSITSVALLAALASAPAVAQQLIYPAKGQSAEQQKKDEAECYAWAKGQTGYDPAQATQYAAAPPRRNMRVSGREALLAGQRVARWLVRSQVTLERAPRLAPLGEPWRAAQGKGVNRKIIKTHRTTAAGCNTTATAISARVCSML